MRNSRWLIALFSLQVSMWLVAAASVAAAHQHFQNGRAGPILGDALCNRWDEQGLAQQHDSVSETTAVPEAVHSPAGRRGARHGGVLLSERSLSGHDRAHGESVVLPGSGSRATT